MNIHGRNWRKTCLSMLLIVTCLLTSFSFYIDSRAESVVRMGTVTASSLNLRTGPGTDYDRVTYLYNGDVGTIIDEDEATDGTVWYKMNINGSTGWASSKYIRVTETVIKEDTDFDAYLAAQGFPVSYRKQLQALHSEYPNWVFEAQQTNLDWAEVISEESKLGKNLVHKSSDSSWKSTQSGAYNWESGEWVEFDSGGWVMASTEIIAHCMDPRNFLDGTNIFQFIKQSYNASSMSSSEITQKKADLTNMVKGTYLAGNCEGSSYVDVIMNVASQTGVCPFTLASMMIQEQGTDGSGRSISGTVAGYVGFYNYLNIGAYKTSTFASAVERGLWYAKGGDSGSTTYGRPWNTRVKAITGGALYYGNNFVNVGQDTLYLKKFNVQGDNKYNHQYMTNVQGAASEGKHVAKAYDANARKAALVFKIPVYNNMPETACSMPTGNDNPNYMLSSLSISGYSLTPTFSTYETSYSLIVPNSVSSVTVSATAVASTTSISGIGTKNLVVGTNTVTVTTKAGNGATRTYTITIVRQDVNTGGAGNTGGSAGAVVMPSISSSAYQVNGNATITGVTGFPVNATTLKSKFAVLNGSVKITTSGGTEKTGDVGTGDQVRVYDAKGALKITYNIVIYGDTNGDGKISALDLLRVQKHILGISKLSGYYGNACDTSKDGKVNALDLLQVQKHILGMKSVAQ